MIDEAGIQLIKQNEGVRLACYHLGDGVCTIGYGHTRPLQQCVGAGSWKITQDQAEKFLMSDVLKYQTFLGYFNRNFNQNQINALTSFEYNLGGGIWKNDGWDRNASNVYITKSMMNYINPPQFREGLINRRNREIEMFNRSVNEIVQPPKPPTGVPSITGKSLETLAGMVQHGEFGSGEQRQKSLGNLFTGVQAIVNERAKVISANESHMVLVDGTMRGFYGNGNNRQFMLGSYFNTVQAIVNQKVGITGKPNITQQQFYTIVSGDTLSRIASKFGTSIAQLMTWNGITNANVIVAGQKIRVN